MNAIKLFALSFSLLSAAPAFSQSVVVSSGDGSAKSAVAAGDFSMDSLNVPTEEPASVVEESLDMPVGGSVMDIPAEGRALMNAVDMLRHDLDYVPTDAPDQDYITMMIRHHRAMVYVIQAALDGAQDEEVKNLAKAQLEHLRVELDLLQALEQPAEQE